MSPRAFFLAASLAAASLSPLGVPSASAQSIDSVVASRLITQARPASLVSPTIITLTAPVNRVDTALRKLAVTRSYPALIPRDRIEVAGVDAEADLDELDLDGDTPLGQALVDQALPLLGARYRWGGVTPSGFDCSGFIYWVLEQTGHPAPRDHGGQLGLGPRVGRGELEAGDLVFFQNTYTAGISHGGIYVGGDQFIHANDERSGVIISDLSSSYWSAHWLGATRVA